MRESTISNGAAACSTAAQAQQTYLDNERMVRDWIEATPQLLP